MSSIINTVYKRPSSVLTLPTNDENKPSVQNGNLIITCMWIIVALVAAARAEFNSSVAGMTISLTAIDAAAMVFVHLMMVWGLENKNHYCVFPWLGISAWSMYSSHYKSIKKMWNLLRVTKLTAALPWITFGLNVIIFSLRLLLILRVITLMLNQWYESKLEKELKYGGTASS